MNYPLAEMFRYNRWANLTLLETCRSLPPEALAARPAGLSGSIGELLTHIVGAQQSFLLRLQGRQNEGELTRESQWPGVDTLVRFAGETSDALIEAAAVLEGDETVDLPFMGKTYRFHRAFFLLHALEHGIEHRTEVKVGLLQLGITTPDLDGWQYAVFAGHGREVV